MRFVKALKRRITILSNKFGGSGNRVKGLTLFQKLRQLYIEGTDNVIEVRCKVSKDMKITIRGNNHRLLINKGVTFKSGELWFEDNSCSIIIGEGVTIEDAQLAVAENNSKIEVGFDCMFSSGIRVATTDSHSIIDIATKNRTNNAADVIIGNHVWVGYDVSINKGCIVGDNSVIAGRSVLTHSVPENVIVAGIPAKVVKRNVSWTRERI